MAGNASMSGFIPNFVRQWGGGQQSQGNGDNSNNGNNQNQNNNNSNQNNNPNNSNQNNNQNNNDSPLGIWDDPASNKGGGDNSNQNNTNQNQNNGNNNNNNQVDPNKQFDDFINGLDLDAKVPQEVFDKLQNGDMSVLPDVLKASAQQAVRQAMMNMSKVMNSRMEDMVTRAVERANTDRNTDTLIGYMHSKLKFTEDPDIEPVAKSILGRALKQGKSRDEAIDIVHRFFDRTSRVAAKAMGGGNNNSNGGPSGNRGFQQYDDAAGEGIDWLKLMSGESQD